MAGNSSRAGSNIKAQLHGFQQRHSMQQHNGPAEWLAAAAQQTVYHGTVVWLSEATIQQAAAQRQCCIA
eukprot:365665-Chlamydomonas_euryale.AAC.10